MSCVQNNIENTMRQIADTSRVQTVRNHVTTDNKLCDNHPSCSSTSSYEPDTWSTMPLDQESGSLGQDSGSLSREQFSGFMAESATDYEEDIDDVVVSPMGGACQNSNQSECSNVGHQLQNQHNMVSKTVPY